MKRFGLFVVTAATLLVTGAVVGRAGWGKGRPAAVSASSGEAHYRQGHARHWRAFIMQR